MIPNPASRPADPAPAPAVVTGRTRPALGHLLASLLVAGLGSFVLVRLWYPSPYDVLAGGLHLLALLVVVDVVLGPALTFVVATPGKKRRTLVLDMAVIAAVQLAALGYGLYTLAIARPVGLVFEVDQFRVVSAADVQLAQLPQAPPGLRELSWTGPRPFAAVKPTDAGELLEAVQLGLGGIDLAMLPKHWRPYDTQRDAVLKAGKPLDALLRERPQAGAAVDALAARAGVEREALRVLPLVSRRSEGWHTLVAGPDARIVGLLPPDAPQ